MTLGHFVFVFVFVFARTLLLGLVTLRHTFLFFHICAPPIVRALTVLRIANKPSRGAGKVKPPRKPQETHTAFSDLTCQYRLCGKHSVCCFPVAAAAPKYLHWRSTDPFLTYAVAHARFQHGDDQAGQVDVARQDDNRRQRSDTFGDCE